MHTSQGTYKLNDTHEDQHPSFNSWPLYDDIANGFSYHENPERIVTGNPIWQEAPFFHQPFSAFDHFADESNNISYLTGLGRDPFKRDVCWTQRQRDNSCVWDAPQLWRTHDRFGSPEGTAPSSVSGSGYCPDTEFASSFEGDLPWHAHSDVWAGEESGCGTSQDLKIQCSGAPGIALREIQSLPDDDLNDHVACTVAPTVNFQSDEVMAGSCGRYENKPDSDFEDRIPIHGDGCEVDDAKTALSYDEDSDYKPPGYRRRRNTGMTRASHGRKTMSKGSHKIMKHVTFRRPHPTHAHSMAAIDVVNEQSIPTPMDDPERPFSCPLYPYGCTATFTSKNEWKRHITSQHICLGFWRCDMCHDVAKGPNDFNRKDLFIQHIRRMHSGLRKAAPEKIPAKGRRRTIAKIKRKSSRKCSEGGHDTCDEELERSMGHIQQRCWIQIREAPVELTCAFCNRVFAGFGCTEEWLEHVGRHLAPKAKVKLGDTKNHSEDVEKGPISQHWERDPMLRQWLLKEALIEHSPAHGKCMMLDKSVVSGAAHLRSLEVLRPLKDESDL